MKSSKKNTDDFFSFELVENNETDFGKGGFTHPDVLTADEILKSENKNHTANDALDSLLKRMTGMTETDNTETEPEVAPEAVTPEEPTSKEDVPVAKPENKPSLLDKCMPYIIDENGNDTSVNKEPLYKLESVAEILKADSEKTLEKLSKEYGISFDNIMPTPAEPEIISQEKPEETFIEEETVVSAEETTTDDITTTHQISDIDIPDSPFYKIESDTAVEGGTVTFTPLTDISSDSKKIVVSTHTKPIEFTGELLKVNEPVIPEAEVVKLEKSDFEEYIPSEEYTNKEDGKAILKKLAKEKKNSFLGMWGSILLTLLLAFFELPFMSDVILTHTKVCMIIASAFTLGTIWLNFNIFTSISKIFSKKADSSSTLILAIISVSLYAIFGIIAGEIILNILLLLSIILCFHAIGRFFKASGMLRSFKQIYNTSRKNGVKLIDDPAITLAMTKGVVEGDTLIASSQDTEQVNDFIKYSTFGEFLDGRLQIITIVSLVLSVLTGVLAATYFDGLVYGFYSAAAIQCMATLPCLFLIDALPLYTSSKKLAAVGAMIAGKKGAEEIEQANAIVLNSKDIFPAGTVTLHQMKVLAENNLEDTLLRAASLTEALQSPLAPIFKKIAGTSNITVLPDSDTVKYEEALGISGWVDNRLLFIGNRTLMESHGISVPSVDVDRKILRQGYFPVYVASQNKACALLIVQYSVNHDVAKELRRLTGSGVTVLVKTSDPNLTEEMICDYLGLYDDSVKVMSAAGCHIYVNTVAPVKTCSAPGSFKSNPLGLPTIINCAERIKRSNIILTAAYFITAVFGILLFAYTSFSGSGSLLSDTALLLYGIISTAVSYLLYLTQRP